MSDARRVEKLRPDYKLEGFDCGREALNRYLLRYAWANQQAGAAQTYVGMLGNTVIGYHTLAVSQVSREEAYGRLTKGLGRHPVPVMLLARLAVGHRWHGQGRRESSAERRDAAHAAGGRHCRHPRFRGSRKRRGSAPLLPEI